MKPYRSDWADRLAKATTDLRSRNSWEYERPCNAWESMPWFVRWPLGIAIGLFFGGNFLMAIVLLWRGV